MGFIKQTYQLSNTNTKQYNIMQYNTKYKNIICMGVEQQYGGTNFRMHSSKNDHATWILADKHSRSFVCSYEHCLDVAFVSVPILLYCLCVYTSIDIHEIDWVVHSFVRKSKTLDIAACPPPEQSAPQPAPPGTIKIFQFHPLNIYFQNNLKYNTVWCI